jgi:hypothetical protein
MGRGYAKTLAPRRQITHTLMSAYNKLIRSRAGENAQIAKYPRIERGGLTCSVQNVVKA